MDLLDRAFVQHTLPCPAVLPREPAPAVTTAPEPVTACPPAAASPSAVSDDPLEVIWDGLAEAVDQATWKGHSVIAVTAAERGVGASTVAVGLARALDRRGRRMAILHGSPLHAGYHAELLELAAEHDLVIVDPGPWFGPGRLRRERLARLSQGCDAAIVVRREAAGPMPAVEAALEAVGLACLGEVLTQCASAAGTADEV